MPFNFVTGFRGVNMFIVRTSKPVKNLWKNGLFLIALVCIPQTNGLRARTDRLAVYNIILFILLYYIIIIIIVIDYYYYYNYYYYYYYYYYFKTPSTADVTTGLLLLCFQSHSFPSSSEVVYIEQSHVVQPYLLFTRHFVPPSLFGRRTLRPREWRTTKSIGCRLGAKKSFTVDS